MTRRQHHTDKDVSSSLLPPPRELFWASLNASPLLHGAEGNHMKVASLMTARTLSEHLLHLHPHTHTHTHTHTRTHTHHSSMRHASLTRNPAVDLALMMRRTRVGIFLTE